MTPDQLRDRLASFAAAVARYSKPLFQHADTLNVASQLTRSASAAMANHRSAGRGRSHSEFTSKLNIAVEEIDECQGWLKYLEQSGDVSRDRQEEHSRLYDEATELTAILTASLTTARRRDQAARTLHHRPKRS